MLITCVCGAWNQSGANEHEREQAMTDELKPCPAYPCSGYMKENNYDASLECSSCQFIVADELEYNALVAGRQAAIDAALESLKTSCNKCEYDESDGSLSRHRCHHAAGGQVMSKNTGGPAFPVIPPLSESVSAAGYPYPDEGMSLRDYFAAKAMQGALSNPSISMTNNHLAEMAYSVADAMIAEREKG